MPGSFWLPDPEIPGFQFHDRACVEQRAFVVAQPVYRPPIQIGVQAQVVVAVHHLAGSGAAHGLVEQVPVGGRVGQDVGR